MRPALTSPLVVPLVEIDMNPSARQQTRKYVLMLTQEEVAKELNCARSQIASMESSNPQHPQTELTIRYETFLKEKSKEKT